MRAKLQDVRRRVATLRRTLLSPSAEEIRLHLPELMEAVQRLDDIQNELRSHGARDAQNGDLAQELQALKKELRMVHRLIDHSVAFYQGWAKLFGSATGGYMSSGEAAPLTTPAVVWMQG